jgi:hypothetical protein
MAKVAMATSVRRRKFYEPVGARRVSPDVSHRGALLGQAFNDAGNPAMDSRVTPA